VRRGFVAFWVMEVCHLRGWVDRFVMFMACIKKMLWPNNGSSNHGRFWVSFLSFATFVRCWSGGTDEMSIPSTLRIQCFTDSLSRTFGVRLDLFKALYLCPQDLPLVLGCDPNQTGRKRGTMKLKLTSVVTILEQHTVEAPD
jgi:hypothetical protein